MSNKGKIGAICYAKERKKLKKKKIKNVCFALKIFFESRKNECKGQKTFLTFHFSLSLSHVLPMKVTFVVHFTTIVTAIFVCNKSLFVRTKKNVQEQTNIYDNWVLIKVLNSWQLLSSLNMWTVNNVNNVCTFIDICAKFNTEKKFIVNILHLLIII